MSICVDGLSFRYGRQTALCDVSLNVEAGSAVGLLGHNGAGKSTLFRILCGLLTPFEGTVCVQGFSLPLQTAQARSVTGYVAQKFALYEDLSVQENLLFYARAYGLNHPTASARAQEMLERFGLGPRRAVAAGTLSQGWKQRLAFAVALAHRPKVLLLDEVTAGLDSSGRRYAWQVIESELAGGTTVLLSTHIEEEADRCQAKVLLDGGRRIMEESA